MSELTEMPEGPHIRLMPCEDDMIEIGVPDRGGYAFRYGYTFARLTREGAQIVGQELLRFAEDRAKKAKP
jgi:hypothetical protein